jgi:DNA-binding winged helix-turn-helix (wHTH) protein
MALFGSFEFDAARRQLSREGREVHLTPKAFDLLKVLLEAAPRVVPKGELHRRLWPTSFVSDATLVGLIKELRRALDDHDPSAPLIRTSPRIGYAFCRTITVTPAQTPLAWHWILVGERRISLCEGENAIGRDPKSAVWLDFAYVSRRHARIVVSDARAVLEDLGSKNGTAVGSERLTGVHELRNGDRLRFGRIDAVFCSSASGLPTVTQVDWSHEGDWSRGAATMRSLE